MLHDLLIVLA